MSIWIPTALRRYVKDRGLLYEPNLNRVWEEEPFLSLYASIKARTLVGRRRCYVLQGLARHIAAIPGALAEVGVYRGGTARLLAQIRPDRPLYLFDTFAGMPATDARHDFHHAGDFADTSLEQVRGFVAAKNVVFRPGVFPDSAAGLEAERFSPVHVDCDIYMSVRACCEWFYPRMNPGGVMVFDDYGYRSCPGAREAVDEFFLLKPEHPFLACDGQAIIFRIPR